MKTTQDVRRYAEEHGLSEVDALAAGMREKSGEFHRHGDHEYLPVVET